MRRLGTWVFAGLLLGSAGSAESADRLCARDPATSELLAFPGAEGFGAFSRGGRGGRVLFVTHTGDSGPGSLREAIETPGPRVVVFRTGGLITLDTMLVVREPYLTLAAHTAPGGGVALRRAGLIIATHDVVVRGLRVRVGDEPEGPAGEQRDGINISATKTKQEIYNVIVDQSSVSWAVDENVATWTDRVRDVTIQWSLVAEALRDSIHVDEGATRRAPHSMGMLLGLGSRRVSVHHCLLAHNDDRNPKIVGVLQAEFVNNVVYNYKSGSTGVSDHGHDSTVHLLHNYYRLGADSGPDVYRFKDRGSASIRVWLEGNLRDAPGGPPRVWTAVAGDASLRADRAVFAASGISTRPAAAAYEIVLERAGAVVPSRDAVDRRIVASVRRRTGRVIDSQDEVGGWPPYAAGSPPPDGDRDGIPDAWEIAAGLDERNFDSDGVTARGCTHLERYLNDLFHP